MTQSVKAANYTAKNVDYMVTAYVNTISDSARKAVVSMLANELGKSTKSVIAKLSREGVYVKAAKATKSGKVIVKKEAMVNDIAMLLDLDFEDVKSLGKATKASLEIVLAAVR